MIELPPELAALSNAASDDEKRRAIAVALAVVTLTGNARADVALAGLVAAAIAAAVELFAARVGWRAPGRHYGAAIASCLLFPLAARAMRRVRLARVRRRYRRAPLDDTWREVAAAWQRASPGQRAALLRLAKTLS